jgi:hypothetical protein
VASVLGKEDQGALSVASTLSKENHPHSESEYHSRKIEEDKENSEKTDLVSDKTNNKEDER